MKFLILAALVACAAATRITPVSHYGHPKDEVHGQYIVQFKPEARSEFESFMLSSKRSNNRHVQSFWDFEDFMGFWAVDVDQDMLMSELQTMPGVMTIEPNTKVQAFGLQNNATWGIDRSDQTSLPLNTQYRWRDNAAGQGAAVYVLDTGVHSAHPDFNGRASFVADCYSLFGLSCSTSGTTNDPQGHGSHCAGTVGSTTYGIAKEVTIFNIRVLSSIGSGTIGGIVNGVNYAVNHNYNGVKIISMSLGGGAASALDNAVNAAFNAGVLSVVATGNSNNNGCTGSPAGAAEAFTVSATDRNDNKASFSSYGPCVDMWAPGVDIVSTSNSGSGTNTFSGTSMATPHVAGAAALVASRGITSPAQIRSTLIAEATAGVVNGVPSGTPNRLLFTSPQ